MSSENKNTQAEYDQLTSTIKAVVDSGNYGRLVGFTNNVTPKSDTHFVYVPVVFEFIRALLPSPVVTSLVTGDISGPFTTGVYYPICHKTIRGIIISIPTLSHLIDAMNVVMVSHDGRLISVVLPYTAEKLLLVDPVAMVSTVLTEQQLNDYSKRFTLLSVMKTYPKMYVYLNDVTKIEDHILNTPLTNLE